MENHGTLYDQTMELAIAFSDIKSMPRTYLILNKKTFELQKTTEIGPQHFKMALDNKIAVIDIKSQQVFDNEELEWKDITKESTAKNAGERAHSRSSNGDRLAKGKEDKKQTAHRKTRRGKSTKRVDSDET